MQHRQITSAASGRARYQQRRSGQCFGGPASRRKVARLPWLMAQVSGCGLAGRAVFQLRNAPETTSPLQSRGRERKQKSTGTRKGLWEVVQPSPAPQPQGIAWRWQSGICCGCGYILFSFFFFWDGQQLGLELGQGGERPKRNR